MLKVNIAIYVASALGVHTSMGGAGGWASKPIITIKRTFYSAFQCKRAIYADGSR